jgi:PhzF family phenazine biosynthesis protein
MSIVRFKQVDAFTRKPFTGNPAGVVLEANGLQGKEMLRIAREINVSETVFVLDAPNEEVDLALRWFSPTQEVDLCGHATIAAFHAMAEEGMFGLEVDEAQSFLVDTKSGVITVDVEWQDLRPYIKMSLPLPSFFPYPGEMANLCGALGLSEIELSRKVNPQITQNGYVFVPVKDFDSLKTLEPNPYLLKRLGERHDLQGFAVVTTDTGVENIDWHMRFFAPAMGINEDPVTGSANGPMAAFLWHNGFLDENQKVFNFKAEQGRFVDRPGIVHIQMHATSAAVEEIMIAGEAVTVMDGQIFMNSNVPGKF